MLGFCLHAYTRTCSTKGRFDKDPYDGEDLGPPHDKEESRPFRVAQTEPALFLARPRWAAEDRATVKRSAQHTFDPVVLTFRSHSFLDRITLQVSKISCL